MSDKSYISMESPPPYTVLDNEENEEDAKIFDLDPEIMGQLNIAETYVKPNNPNDYVIDNNHLTEHFIHNAVSYKIYGVYRNVLVAKNIITNKFSLFMTERGDIKQWMTEIYVVRQTGFTIRSIVPIVIKNNVIAVWILYQSIDTSEYYYVISNLDAVNWFAMKNCNLMKRSQYIPQFIQLDNLTAVLITAEYYQYVQINYDDGQLVDRMYPQDDGPLVDRRYPQDDPQDNKSTFVTLQSDLIPDIYSDQCIYYAPKLKVFYQLTNKIPQTILTFDEKFKVVTEYSTGAAQFYAVNNGLLRKRIH
jgi:hypothetical protein